MFEFHNKIDSHLKFNAESKYIFEKTSFCFKDN